MVSGLPSLEELAKRSEQTFPTLTGEQLARLAAGGVEKDFDAAAIVYDQGDVGVPFFVVLKGELEILSPQEPHASPFVVLKERQFTGEVNLLANRRSLVRARAKTAVRLLCVENQRLKSLIQTDFELSDLLMRAFILRRTGLLSAGYSDTVVIGSRDSAGTLSLQEFLTRNLHPYRYLDVDRDAPVQAMLDQFKVDVKEIPVVICRGSVVLRNPTNARVADCLGFNPAIDAEALPDLIICGAGPSGLAAAVYGASEGLDVLLIEANAPGGQAGTSSKIENYLGFPTGISGQALAARALAQAEKFGARLVVARGVVGLGYEGPTIRVALTDGKSLRSRAVVIATGAEYRRLDVPGLERFEGRGIYYAATYIESQRCEKDSVVVVGGGNSAGQAATFLARSSREVHLLVRGPDLSASMSRYLIRRIEETPNIQLHRRTRIIALDGTQHLERVTWRDDLKEKQATHPIRHVFAMTGATPNTEWLRGCVAMDQHGFVQTGSDLTAEILKDANWPIHRPPYPLEASHPRVFAIGDVRANSMKRVAAAVGEGSACIRLVHQTLSE